MTTVALAKSVPGDRRDMLEMATPHPHPTNGTRYGWPWEAYGSQPWPSWTGSAWPGTYFADYSTMWRTQPSLRKVVDFLARNIAQVPAYLYRRISDTDRERISDHPLARTLINPHPSQSRYRFMEALVTELSVFDRGWAVEQDHDGDELWMRWVPASWSGWTYAADGTLAFRVWSWAGEQWVAAEDVFELAGYNPSPPQRCPPCETLRQVLAEEQAGTDYRADLWRNGARLAGTIERPLEAPEWSDTARERFRREWQGRWTQGSQEAGGTPVLEEGMKFNASTATAEQSQYVEARKLTLAEVASAYQVPPPMVGLLDNANFANTREFRKMLYQDTLGPWFELLSEELERQVMPRWPDLTDCYIEFNVQAKLAGAFEDQAEVLSRSVGAPWLTRNEARARQNLPRIEGGDELITPLNVIEGGQPSPATPILPSGAAAQPGPLLVPSTVQRVAARALTRDHQPGPADRVAALLASGEADEELVWRLAVWFANKGDQKHPEWELRGGNEGRVWLETALDAYVAKAAVPGTTREDTETALVAKLVGYLTAQERAVVSALAAGAALPQAFDHEAQDAKLTRLLVPSGWTLALLGAAGVLDAAEQRAFQAAPMGKWLTSTAGRSAFAMNEATYQQLGELAAKASWRDDTAHLYAVARDARAPQQAQTWGTTATSFGGQEAAKTTGRATKTWRVTSRNPRASHAKLDGVTVGVHDAFPNGARYPGDPYLSEDQRAGCQCAVEYARPEPAQAPS